MITISYNTLENWIQDKKELTEAEKELTGVKKELTEAEKELTEAEKELTGAKKELTEAEKELTGVKKELQWQTTAVSHYKKVALHYKNEVDEYKKVALHYKEETHIILTGAEIQEEWITKFAETLQVENRSAHLGLVVGIGLAIGSGSLLLYEKIFKTPFASFDLCYWIFHMCCLSFFAAGYGEFLVSK